MKKLVPAVACVFMAGCQQTTGVVSSHSMYGQPYISKQHYTQQEYVSALMEAQGEEEVDIKEDDLPVKVSSSVRQPTYIPSPAERMERNAGAKPLSMLWGKPSGVMGEGVTLMNAETRKRLNDALATTPLSSEVKFQHAGRHYIFMPNSEVYQPYRTGGRCRDGIVIHYDGQIEEQVRGLFCQQGLGVDWLLMR